MVSTVDKNRKFSFEPITADDISQEIKRLDINKATQEGVIPTKLVKSFDNLIVDYLQEHFNNCLKKGTFPKNFKKAVVHPTHKKDCKTEKSNHRPISILPNLSEIHERILYDQMYTYFSNFFPQYQCGFRKGYIAQHCLLAMTEKMKETRDNNKVCAVVLTDLSEAFDCLLHDLLISKLHAFGFDLKSLRVIHAYLNDRIQVTKVGSFYSEILQIIYGVPQVLFNVNLIDLFLAEHYKSDFSSYVYDTTPYNCRSTFLETISYLERTLDNLFNWFCNKQLPQNVICSYRLLM